MKKKIDGNFAPDKELLDEEEYTAEQFLELTPLNYEIENSPQQDLASVSINEVEIPKVVYI